MKVKDIIGTDIVVNCKSIEEYEKLEKEYKKICKDGDGIIYKQRYNDQTCYRLTEYTMKYDSALCYESTNRKIIQLSDLEEFSITSENYEIHITNKGNNTYGAMKANGEIIKRVETVKHPLDEFSFEVASETIMDRLFDRENKKVKEVKRKAKVGDEVIIIDNGEIYPTPSSRWFDGIDTEYCLRFAYETLPPNSEVEKFKIVAIIKTSYGDGYLIYDRAKTFLIGEKGIKKL